MLEDVYLLCKKLSKIYSSYKLDEEDTEAIQALNKIKKVFITLGFDDESILNSLIKFKNKYKNLDESWYRKQVNFFLYNDTKLVKGPGLYLSVFYRMASKIDRKEKTTYKIKLTALVLGLLESEPDIKLLESLVDDPLLNDQNYKALFLWSCKELKTEKPEDFFASKEFQKKLDEV